MGIDSLAEASYLELVKFFGPRILMALLCGGLVGLERELKNKSAGIKTNMLICVGSSLFTTLSVLISSAYVQTHHVGDPGRLAAQIVSGIGFLGGGAIIQSRGTITGLTTAATIWVVAAIGVCSGLGYTKLALTISVLVVLTLVAITFLEGRFLSRSMIFECIILAEDPQGEVRKTVNWALERHDLMIEDFDIEPKGELTELQIKYRGNLTDHKKFVLELWGTNGIREVRQA